MSVRNTIVATLPLLLALGLVGRARADDTQLLTTLDGTTTFSGRVRDLTPDGRFVLFVSRSADYVSGDTNGIADLFLQDRELGTVERINVASDGSQDSTPSASELGASISADGQFVAFETHAPFDPDDRSFKDVYLRDRVAGTTTLVSRTKANRDGDSYSPRISRDGSHVVFASDAKYLIDEDTNGETDVFEWDRATGTITRVSTDSTGGQLVLQSFDPLLSQDGSLVAFSNGVLWGHGDHWVVRYGAYVKDTIGGALERVDADWNGDSNRNAISDVAGLSPDGRFVLINTNAPLVPDDTNSWTEGYVRDRTLATTSRVTLGTGGQQLDGYPIVATGMSDDARRILFTAKEPASVDDENGLVDSYVFNRDTEVALRVSLGPDDAEARDKGVFSGPLSSDGLLAVFETDSSTIWSGDDDDDWDVFMRALSDVPAAWNNYDSGFPGRNGVPALTLTDLPRRGSSVALAIGNSSGIYTVAILFVGLSSQSLPTSFGGTLLVDPFTSLSIALSPWDNTQSLTIPTGGDLPGLHVYLQALELDPAAAKGVSFTPGLDMTIGD